MKKRTRRLPKGVYLRGHTYYVDVSVDGRRVRRSAGTQLEDALRLLASFEEEETSQTNGQATRARPRPAGPTLERAVERYLERTRLYSKTSSVQSAESSCRRLLGHFRTKRVHDLESRDVESFIAARLNHVSREAVNRDLRYLKAILRLTVDEGLLDQVPLKIALLRTTKKLPTILTSEELRRLFAAADDRLRPLLMTAAMAGLRHSELSALDWSDIYLAQAILRVRTKPEIGFSPKSHAERQIPLNKTLCAVLEQHAAGLNHHGPRDPVFQRNARTASRWEASALCKAVRETFKKVGLYRPEARPGLHMLRRSFASHALGRQADIQTVRELGGWSSLAVVERYVASTEELKRSAADKLDFG